MQRGIGAAGEAGGLGGLAVVRVVLAAVCERRDGEKQGGEGEENPERGLAKGTCEHAWEGRKASEAVQGCKGGCFWGAYG